jgi:hypothetical protein
MDKTAPCVQTVAVDFDGVLHTYEYGWYDGTIYGNWMPGALTGLIQLMQRYAVFVHTTRDAKQVARWIEEQSGRGIECTTRAPRSGFWTERGVLLVTVRKFAAIAYIDDRAVHFTSWPEALTAVGIATPEGGTDE